MIWNRFVPNKPTTFLLDCCRQRKFYLEYYYLRDQWSVLYAQYFNSEPRKKRLNHFKSFNFVDSDNIFQITNYTKLNAALSSYQAVLPCALYSELWSCVWMGNRANPHFFINEILNSKTAMVFQIFQHFIQWIAKNLAFFFLYSSRKNVCKLTVMQLSAVPHNSVQDSCTPKRLLCGSVPLWRTIWVTLDFAINKNSHFHYKVSICQLNI